MDQYVQTGYYKNYNNNSLNERNKQTSHSKNQLSCNILSETLEGLEESEIPAGVFICDFISAQQGFPNTLSDTQTKKKYSLMRHKFELIFLLVGNTLKITKQGNKLIKINHDKSKHAKS